MSDDTPADPFHVPDEPDLDSLADTVAGFYLKLLARTVPEERAAQFACQLLQTWIPVIMMANAAAQGQA